MTEIKKFIRSPFGTIEGYDDLIKKLNGQSDVPEIKQEQTRAKVESNQSQSEVKVESNWSQSRVKVESQNIETRVKLEPQLESNQSQSRAKAESKSSFSDLVGLQRALAIFIFNECQIVRAKTTKGLTLEYISSVLNSSSFCSIKKALQRLISKQIIERTEFKNGRGGWSKYTLPDPIFQEVLQYETGVKLESKWSQSRVKVETQPEPNIPVVSSSYINTTTNILEGIDLDMLEELGFNQSHLRQIEREYQLHPQSALTAEDIQNSIYNFIFDLKHNKDKLKFRNDPITVLISLLRQGKPYTSVTPSKFKTPRQEALDSYRLAKEQNEQLEIKTREEIKNKEYDKWLRELEDRGELLSLYPEEDLPKGMPQIPKKAAWRRKAIEVAKDYFMAEIWPNRKKEIEQETSNKV